MAHETLAPWAEKVEGVGPMTADELFNLPEDDEWQYELVDGVLVRMPSPGYQHGKLVNGLTYRLTAYVETHHLGDVLNSDTGFILSQASESDTVLGPDIAFVQSTRAPAPDAPDFARYQRLAPDLVIEVASPSQYRPELAAKARRYLESGVRLVWGVWPPTKSVDVWRTGADAPIATLTTADTLDGLNVVPGFSYSVAELFA